MPHWRPTCSMGDRHSPSENDQQACRSPMGLRLGMSVSDDNNISVNSVRKGIKEPSTIEGYPLAKV